MYLLPSHNFVISIITRSWLEPALNYYTHPKPSKNLLPAGSRRDFTVHQNVANAQ